MSPIDFSKINFNSLDFVTFLQNSKNDKKIRRIIGKLSAKDKLILTARVLNEEKTSYKELKKTFNLSVSLLKQRLKMSLRKIHRELLKDSAPALKLSELTNREKIKQSIKNILNNHAHPFVLAANVRFTRLIGFSFMDYMDELNLDAIDIENYGQFKRAFGWFRQCLIFMTEMPEQDVKEKFTDDEINFTTILPTRTINALNAAGVYSRVGLKYYPIQELEGLYGVGKKMRAILIDLIKKPYNLKKYEETIRDNKMITPFWYEVNYILQKHRKR